MRPHTEPLELVGESPAMALVRAEIEYASRCDAKILITGESGVGKEVVARLIHAGSLRRHNPLVTVNCAALTESLLETELFGHVRGSFTGAVRDRSGVLEQAHRGTAFLDEVGETTPRMQGLLLRFLETGEIQRVGSDRPELRVDVRVISATNRNLADSVAAKTFREDLFYRLNVIHLHLPPLRERLEDVSAMLRHFLAAFARQYQVPVPVLSDDALNALTSYQWPGNVRELKNVVERLVVRNRNPVVEVADLPKSVLRADPTVVRAVGAPPSNADLLYEKVVVGHESFWSAVYTPFMSRDLTREDLRTIVRKGLEQTDGSYRLLVELFNMEPSHQKRFVDFLKKHQCYVAFQPFRTIPGRPLNITPEDLDDRPKPNGAWKKSASA